MARFMKFDPKEPFGDGDHYLDLEAIIIADFNEGRDPLNGGGLSDPYPQVVVYTSIAMLPPVTIKNPDQVASIRAYIDGRSHC